MFFWKEKMITRKIQTFFLTAIPFGTSVSFFYAFSKQEDLSVSLMPVFAVFLVCLGAFFPKIHKDLLTASLKAQPLAAVIFTSSFILSFLSDLMILIQLFAVLILNTVCVCMAYERKKEFKKKSFFGICFLSAAVFGSLSAVCLPSSVSYLPFVLASLACRPFKEGRTPQDLWKDIAFPLFVLVCSFLLFVAASHAENFSFQIGQYIVMIMVGGLLISAGTSGMRLMLMSAVLIVFGCYVFSAQNPQSLFNGSGRGQVKIQRTI